MPPIVLDDFHVDIAIGRVVVIEDSAPAHNLTADFEQPIGFRFRLLLQNGAFDVMSCGDPLLKDDLLADNAARPQVEHDHG